MRAAVGVGLVAIGVGLGAGSARAEGQRIEVRVDRGFAEIKVRREVAGGATVPIEVPPGAVARGLRIRGERGGEPHWFDGSMLVDGKRARPGDALSPAARDSRDAAILGWSGGPLELRLLPAGEDAAGVARTVEYTLEMPTTRAHGRDVITLPALASAGETATIVAAPAHRGDVLFLAGQAVPAPATHQLGSLLELEIAIEPDTRRPLDGALAVVPIAGGRALVHYQVDAAPRMSEVPRGARLVVVLDASRSLAAEDAAAEVAAARTYLAHFQDADAQAEVVTFDRRVSMLHDALVPVADAIRDLEGLRITRRNGSAVDEALAAADALLAGAGPGQRRILLMTDRQTKAALQPSALGVRSGATLHIATIRKGSPDLARDDDDRAWAAPARATGGLLWTASASAEPSDAPAMAASYEPLARPTRIDRLRIRAPGTTAERDGDTSRVLDEGDRIELLAIAPRSVPWVSAEGEIWSRSTKRVLLPDVSEGRRWAGLSIGSDLLYDFTPAETSTLAQYGHVVSPQTSLFAAAPGVDPPDEGLGLWGGGISHCGIGTNAPGIGMGIAHVDDDRERTRLLRDRLEDAWRSCGGGRSVSLVIETTGPEVVDVRGAAPRCIEDAAWQLDLPAEFSHAQHTYTVPFDPPGP